jgi:hypothetical protein
LVRIMSQPSPDEFFRVDGIVRAYAHRKTMLHPPCLVLVYRTEVGPIRDYLPIEYDTPAVALIAARAWFQLGGDPPQPATVVEALDRLGELTPREISLCIIDGWWRVVGRHCYATLPPARAWAFGPPPPMWDDDDPLPKPRIVGERITAALAPS